MTSLWLAQLLRPRPGTYRKPVAAKLGLRQLEDRVTPAAFTPGNFVVERIGTGAATLTAREPVFLDEYTPAGTVVQCVTLPTAADGANSAFLDSGTATSGGQMTRSLDGRFLTVPGTAGDQITANNSVRVIGVVNGSGVIDTTTTSPNSATYAASNFRSVVSTDGASFFTGGTSVTTSGTRYWATTGANAATTQLSTTVTNIRSVNIFGGQLFVSANSGTFIGVSRVGVGAPTASGQTTTLLSGTSTAANAYAFVFLDRAANAVGLDTLYVADQSRGLIKFSSDDGNTWTERGNVLTGAIGGGLTADIQDDGSVRFLITSASSANNSVVTYTDSAAYTVNLSGAVAALATPAAAGLNRVFRGLAWAPEATSPAPTVLSINRQSPLSQAAPGPSVTYRVTFSKAVYGLDAGDFTVTTVAGTVAGTASAVTAVVGSGNTQFDVTRPAAQ